MKIFLPFIIVLIISLKGGLIAQGPCEDIAKVNAQWWANWETINHCLDVPAEFVPHVTCWTVPDSLPEGTKWAMGPNETNYDWPGYTCPMTPEQAAQTMRALNVAFPDVKWVSPSVSACRPSLFDSRCIQDGAEWMAEYVALCPDCQEAIAAHWYCYDQRDLASYLAEMGKYGIPVWVTEWGCNDLDVAIGAMVIIEHKTVRHAWFALRLQPEDWPLVIAEQTLVNPVTGKLTELGLWYGGQ